MKKWLSLVLAILAVLTLCSCDLISSISQVPNSSTAQSKEQTSTLDESEPVKEELVKYDSYQAILDEYTVKLQDSTPILIGEYESEASNNNDGLEGLATICNAKVTKLAEISNEGVSEMAEYYYKNGSGSYEEYSEWAGKLMDVYMEEAGKIQNAYMELVK